jgi:hypothetical protein
VEAWRSPAGARGTGLGRRRVRGSGSAAARGHPRALNEAAPALGVDGAGALGEAALGVDGAGALGEGARWWTPGHSGRRRSVLMEPEREVVVAGRSESSTGGWRVRASGGNLSRAAVQLGRREGPPRPSLSLGNGSNTIYSYRGPFHCTRLKHRNESGKNECSVGDSKQVSKYLAE